MDVEWSSEKIRMIREDAHSIQEFINLGLGWGFGLRVGLAVDLLGTRQDVEKDIIRELQRMLLQSFVLIMERSTLRVQRTIEFHPILIGSVERTTLHILTFLIGRKRKVTMSNQNAMDILATLSETRTILSVFGLVVETMQLMAAVLVLRWNISLLNGLMRRLNCTSMISQEDLILIDL